MFLRLLTHSQCLDEWLAANIVCNCKNAITATLSIRLEQAFGTPSAETWMKMQAKYDVWVAQQSDTNPIEPIRAA